jgi:hypothetical protein
MSLISIIKGILNINKKLEIKELPSQGLFYKDDFEIYINRANIDDIFEYEYKYDPENLSSIIIKLKKIVEKNTTFSKKYTFNDIKSIDIVYIFLEIVKLTNGSDIELDYFNEILGKEEKIIFGSKTFNYFKLDDDLLNKYDSVNKEFNFDGYRYSVPCIGVENSLSNFLIAKSFDPDSVAYNDYSYDFLYFLGDKSNLLFNEIENLIQIFNFDIDNVEKNKIRDIVRKMSFVGKYSLKNNSQTIDVTSKIDLSKIWK